MHGDFGSDFSGVSLFFPKSIGTFLIELHLKSEMTGNEDAFGATSLNWNTRIFELCPVGQFPRLPYNCDEGTVVPSGRNYSLGR
jgi:hypothetical protein